MAMVHGATARSTLPAILLTFLALLPPRAAAQQGGSFVGIGIQLDQPDDGSLRIPAVIPRSPAAAAGVMAGDVILKIDGQSTVGMQLPQVVRGISGPAGSKVTLSIRHSNGTVQDFVLTRQAIVIGQPPSRPYWVLLVFLAAMAPLGWWIWHRRQRLRRIEGNLCVACGYDLRATPDRCPECGAVATQSSAREVN